MDRRIVLATGLAASLLVSGAAFSAEAQTQRGRTETLAGGQSVESQARQNRPGLQWNGPGRWGLNLNVDQPVGRETDWSDVDAGASYRVSPSLRLRGSVGLGERRADPARPPERDQPRVRLETIFRF